MSIVSCQHVSRVYGEGDAKVTALYDATFNIPEGEFTVFTGPSGSGKSTLLHLLGGLDLPSGGTIRIEGQDLYGMPEKRRAVFRRRTFGFVFQAFNLLPVLTAEENILMPLLLDKRHKDDVWFQQLTSMLGLTDRLRHLPRQLSGGQQQRVAIARALVAKPRIIFADEPTGNLDTETGNEVLSLCYEAAPPVLGSTIIMITHDLNIAAQAERRIHIVDGRLKERAE